MSLFRRHSAPIPEPLARRLAADARRFDPPVSPEFADRILRAVAAGEAAASAASSPPRAPWGWVGWATLGMGAAGVILAALVSGSGPAVLPPAAPDGEIVGGPGLPAMPPGTAVPDLSVADPGAALSRAVCTTFEEELRGLVNDANAGVRSILSLLPVSVPVDDGQQRL